MDNDKVYFALQLKFNDNYVANTGYVFNNLNLYKFLSSIWNKYTAFNIKVEATPVISSASAACLHMSGLQWINGYDSISPNYTNSRALEIIYSGNIGTYGPSYISNTNAIGFYRPSSFNVNLVFYWIYLNGDLSYDLTSTYSNTIIFSVTGIDAYKIQNPQKGLRYSYQNKFSSILPLTYYDGVSIDPIDSTTTKGRIRKFSNINLRNIIGNEIYDKYNKFALVTRRIINLTTVTLYGTGNDWYQYCLSSNNISFENPGYDITNFGVTATEVFCNPVIIGFNNLRNAEFYIQYVFSKPLGNTTDLTIHYSYMNFVSLANANTTNSNLFPNVQFIFEIIPIKD